MTGNHESGLKSAETIRKRYGDDYYTKLASKGGKSKNAKATAQKLKDKYGLDYFKTIRKGGKQNVKIDN
jgi:hypothetical protein